MQLKMKMIELTLLILMFFLLTPIAYSLALPQTSFNISRNQYNYSRLKFFDDFIDDGSHTVNSTKWPTIIETGTCADSVTGTDPADGLSYWIGQTSEVDKYCGWVSNVAANANEEICIDIRMKRAQTVAGAEWRFLGGRNNGINGATSGNRMIMVTGATSSIGIYYPDAWQDSGRDQSAGYWYNYTIRIASNGDFQLFINNTVAGTSKSVATLPELNYMMATRSNDDTYIDFYYVYNCTEGFPTQPPPIGNAAPEITVNFPTNESHENDIPLGFNISVADDGAYDITCIIGNQTQEFNESTFAQDTDTIINYPSFEGQNQNITFNITCFDNEPGENLSQKLVWQIFVDTVNPQEETNDIVNNSIITGDITYTIVVEDDNIYNLSYIFYNTTDIVLQKHNGTPTGNQLKIQIPITTEYGDDGYNINLTYGDEHTLNKFPDLYSIYQDGTLTFYKADNPTKSFSLDFGYKVNDNIIQKVTSQQIQQFNIQKLLFNKTDRINFGFEADTPNPTLDIKFGFKFEKFKKLKLVNEQQALFHLYDRYWLDFNTIITDVGLDISYQIPPVIYDGETFWAIIYDIDFDAYGLQEGDRFQFLTQSVGMLNIINKQYNITIDTTSPSLDNDGAYCESCDTYTQVTYERFFTNITTPSFNLTTIENSTCAIISNETGSYNMNYSDIIAGGGEDCELTEGYLHNCTISDSMPLGVNNSVYIGCKDVGGNEPLTATAQFDLRIYTYSSSGSADTCTMGVGGCIRTSPGCSWYQDPGCVWLR